MKTTADHIAAASAILDAARRGLEELAANPSGDDDVDEIVSDALTDIEANITALAARAAECV